MKRLHFLAATFSLIPASAMSKMKTAVRALTPKPFRVKAGEARFGERFLMKGVTSNTLDIKISGADTEGALAVFEQTGLTPNGGPPLHLHVSQDEWFYVIQGEYLFQVGDEKYELKSGDTIFLPRNIPHSFIQLSDKANVIVSYLPAGKMEDFFKTTAAWTVPPSKELIAQTFEQHGMKITGPPLKVG
jgi:quercetin dioxygenase-like cupin family protein